MKFYFALWVGLCLTASQVAFGRYIELRGAVEDAKCERLYDFFVRLMEVFKTEKPKMYQQLVVALKITRGIDISEPANLKPFICKIANAKNLREIYAFIPGISYDKFVSMYTDLQKLTVNNGGYTNTRRIMGIYFDFKGWLEAKPVSDPSQLKNSRTLPEVERFFEVMQIKYGSRWLSYLAKADKEEILITDPDTMAKDLFESTSQQDFQTRTEMKEEYVKNLWEFLKSPPSAVASLQFLAQHKYLDLVVESEMLAGDLGLYNLEY